MYAAPHQRDRRLLVIALVRKEDVGHVFLWIAIVEREQARLDLHHDPVSGLEHMIHRRQAELVFLHLICGNRRRSEEHTSELQSLMRSSYAVFCLKKKICRDYNTEK